MQEDKVVKYYKNWKIIETACYPCSYKTESPVPYKGDDKFFFRTVAECEKHIDTMIAARSRGDKK